MNSNKLFLAILVLAGVFLLLILHRPAPAPAPAPKTGATPPVAVRSRVIPHPATVLHLPAPRIQAAPLPASITPTNPPATGPMTLHDRILSGNIPRLSHAQVDAYLLAYGRTAATLLAAYHASGDLALLQEALQKFPQDPRLAFAAAVNSAFTPTEQRQWLDTLAAAAPDNALPNYLSALGYFNNGQTDQAVEELLASAGKHQFETFTSGAAAGVEQAYLSAGYTETEAKVFATLGQTFPEAGYLRQLSQDMVSLADGYQQTGDPASAQAALLLAANLGQSYALTSGNLLTQLVGWSVETAALKALDPNTPYGDSGQTVQNQLDQIARQRAELKDLVARGGPLLQAMSDSDWAGYITALQSAGEVAALQWLIAQKAR